MRQSIRFIAPVPFVVALITNVWPPVHRSALAGQGKGGEVVAKPTTTPKKTKPKRTAPPRTTNNSKTNQATKAAGEAAYAAELVFWNSIKDSANPDDFTEYLKKYPQGQFAGLATNRLKSLTAAQTSPSPKLEASSSASFVPPVTRPCSPPSGMESWYRAEDNAYDTLGMGNGILKNGAAFAPGKVGRAFSFNGIDQFVSVENNKNTSPVSFTIAAWINFSRFERGSVVASHYDGRWHGWILQSFENGNFQFQVLKAPEVQKAAYGSIGAIAPNTWVHVAGTYDGTTITLYINGSIANTAEFRLGYSPSTIPLTIGKASWYEGNFFPGKVDEVQFFSRALSAAEIRSIVNAGDEGNCHPSSE